MGNLYIKTAGMYRSGHHGVMYWLTKNMDKNTIIYDKFVTDEQYRSDIGKSIGLNDNCKYLFDYVSRDGGGSSFTGIDVKLADMELTSRWKHLNKKDIEKIMERDNILKFIEEEFPDNLKKIKDKIFL